MNLDKIRIVADSSADVTKLTDISFSYAPLKIITAQKEYVDDNSLDVLSMVNDLKDYKGKSSTSCPNASDWLNAFGDAEWVFCVTITATLSGSYNSAMLAKSIYEEEHPGRRVFVLNSLSAGPQIALTIDRLRELILAGKDFDNIGDEISEYAIQRTGLVFMLESMKNLANNGRVSPLVAGIAGILGIRVIGKASDKGDLEPLDKCRGEKRSLDAIVDRMVSLGFSGGKVRIAHCFNESAAKKLAELIEAKFDNAFTCIRIKTNRRKKMTKNVTIIKPIRFSKYVFISFSSLSFREQRG